MTQGTEERIQELAVQIVAEHPGGIRLAALVSRLLLTHPDIHKAAIAAVVTRMEDDRIRRPGPDVFAPVVQPLTEHLLDVRPLRPLNETVLPPVLAKEEDFYGPLAQWLRDDKGEVTVAEVLGGSPLRAKWGTPDVLAAYKPLAKDRVKFPIELVSAEVKIDPSQSMTAFGQAISYRLFSTRTYVVMPRTMLEEPKSRLEALCLMSGVGLVYFTVDQAAPDFTMVLPAQRHSPNMFYVNELADRLYRADPAMFEKVFG